MTFLLCAIAFLFLVILVMCLNHTQNWCKSHTCLVGKTAIITGANTGIGYETALDFAKRGARVILACRNHQRAEQAKRQIIQETDNLNIEIKTLDLASFKSVRHFAQDIIQTEERLDILVNNAGMLEPSPFQTEDGNQIMMQVNYLSPTLLTLLLIGVLKKTKDSRIVNVSSISAKLQAGDFNVTKIDGFPGRFKLYGYTKLCNILFTMELAGRLNGTSTTVYSLHPGLATSDIFRSNTGFMKLFWTIMKWLFFKSSKRGAQTTIYCSVAKNLEKFSGSHFEDCARVKRYKTATDKLAKELWDVTVDKIQLKSNEIDL